MTPQAILDILANQETMIAQQKDLSTLLFFLFLGVCLVFGGMTGGVILRHLFKGW